MNKKDSVNKLKIALVKKKDRIKSVPDDKVYDIIDKIMKKIAKSDDISGQELHDKWVDKHGMIPDKWIMKEETEIKTFADFIREASLNKISKESKEISVVGNKKYDSPTDYKKTTKKIGNIGPLEIHRVDNEQGGTTHFTYHPEEKKIHHVVHAVQSTNDDSGTKLKYLSAHGREGSPVRMGQVYTKLMKDHKTTFTGTGHSPGAAKMWDRFHDDPDVEVLGHHPDTGETVKLNKGDKKYGDLKSKDPAERKLGKMQLIARKKSD